MKKTVAVTLMTIAVLSFSCRKEQQMQPLDEYQSADLQAAGNNFYVYGGAQYLPEMTNVQRRAHFVLHPGATSAPPIATYHSDATVQQVAEFYAQKYGYPEVAPNETNNFSSVPPNAYYRAGDLQSDAKGMEPLIPKLGLKTDITKAQGKYTGAQIQPKPDFPRITIQRPYFDPITNQVVDKTLIIMVKE